MMAIIIIFSYFILFNILLLQALNKRGYTRMILQIGNTNLKPNCTPRCGFTCIEAFNLRPSIQEYINSADLVISHAGAGSCLEVLEANKSLIVVINELLMDNHQLELADQLAYDNYLFKCTCLTLLDVIITMNLSELKIFNDNSSSKIARTIDKIMGVI